MGPTVLLWGFGALLAVVTAFVWLQLVRLALHGRWFSPRPLPSPADRVRSPDDDRADGGLVR